jgi:TolA-binding protein
LRKLMLLAAMLALALALAVPAIAQVQEGFEQSTDQTGDFEASLEVSNTGNNSSQCVAPTQFGNTGNLQNAQGFLQYESQLDDVEFSGSSMEFAPEQTMDCTGKVQQAASASN